MKVINIGALGVLLLTNQVFGQDSNQSINFGNHIGFGGRYQSYHSNFISLDCEMDTTVLNTLAFEIMQNAFKLRREERLVYFSNSISDTILSPEIKICMLLITSGDEYANYVYLKYEINRVFLGEFDNYLTSMLKKDLKLYDSDLNCCNFKSDNLSFSSLLFYAYCKYLIIVTCDFDEFKGKSKKMDLNYKFILEGKK